MSYDEREERRWDLTPVIDLIHSLSPLEPSALLDAALLTTPSQDGVHSLDANHPASQDEQVSILGNFDNIWTSLGKPLNVPPPEVKWAEVTDGEADGGKPEESDPEAEPFAASKGVRWRDEDGTADLEDNDEPESTQKIDGDGGRRRKRPGKRERRLLKTRDPNARRGRARGPGAAGTTSSDFESENELQDLRESPNAQARARRSNGLLSPSSAAARGGSAAVNYESSGPSSASPPKASILKPPLPWPVSNPSLQSVPYPQIESVTGYSAAERKISLVMKLVKEFPEDCDTLVKKPEVLQHSRQTPASTPNGGAVAAPAAASSPDGIHVFVDCSNIMIGFFDTLKRARGIPATARVRRVPMSFHNLALIMERGRPAAKRVLVGSNPLIPAVQEAQSCGYETSILDRVMKARELTPRKQHFQDQERRAASRKGAGGTGSGTGPSSGSESAAAASASASASSGPAQRLVEQAVDEILHLKLLESVVDAAAPSTIVLATGDAAEAEYSPGFLRMVERALEKGWSVELVSFAQNTSYAYRKRHWREKWGGRFRVVELDAYREELLDI